MSPCPDRVGYWRLNGTFAYPPSKNAAGAHICRFQFFASLICFFRAPTLQSLPKLLSRRVLRISAVCTDEVLSGINPPSQSGIEPERAVTRWPSCYPLGHRDPRLFKYHPVFFTEVCLYCYILRFRVPIMRITQKYFSMLDE